MADVELLLDELYRTAPSVEAEAPRTEVAQRRGAPRERRVAIVAVREKRQVGSALFLTRQKDGHDTNQLLTEGLCCVR